MAHQKTTAKRFVPKTVTGAHSSNKDLGQFAIAVLQGIRAPVTRANIAWIIAWSRFEGSTAANNPMDTTQRTSGSVGTYNSVGVQEYGSFQAGVAATVQTLKNGYYPEIIAGFQSGNIHTAYTSRKTKILPQLMTWGGGAIFWQNVASASLSERVSAVANRIKSGGKYYNVRPGAGNTVEVKVDGKWYKAKNGHWVGAGPPVPHGASLLGELGHYAIHPGAGVQKTVSAAKGPLDSALMRVIYAVVMVGGFLLLITGFAMIGLDLTLGKSSTAKKALEIAGVAGLAGKVNAGSQARRALRAPTDKELKREYRRGENQGTRAEARSQGRKVARSRIAKPENLKPQPKYSGKDDSGSVPF